MDPLSDLASLDREIATTVARLKLARERLSRGEEPASPFDVHRRTSQQKTYDALRSLPVSKMDEPWRDALLLWVGDLVLARTSFPLEEEEFKRSRFTPEDDNGLSYRDAFGQVCGTTDPRRLEHAWGTWERRAPRVAAVAMERRVRSFEVARRLGFAHPLAPRLDRSHAEIAAAADEFLRCTDALAHDRVRRSPPPDGMSPAIHRLRLAHAVGATEGWPRHVSARWVEESFPAFSRELNSLPLVSDVPVSPMSFARAARFAGVFLRETLAPSALPFALQREVNRTGAWAWGGTFAAALGTKEFHERALGISKNRSEDAARHVAEGFLFSLRIQAALTLVDLDERPDAIYRDVTARVFERPLARDLAGAWPGPLRDTVPRFWGALLGDRFALDLIHRFDTDWFRNPRVAVELRMRSRAPVLNGQIDAIQIGRQVALHFEQVLA